MLRTYSKIRSELGPTHSACLGHMFVAMRYFIKSHLNNKRDNMGPMPDLRETIMMLHEVGRGTLSSGGTL